MNKLFKKLSKKNLNEVRVELARAHLIVALLALVVITLVTMGATQPIAFDQTLSAICVVLLSVVAIISLSTSITIYRKK